MTENKPLDSATIRNMLKGGSYQTVMENAYNADPAFKARVDYHLSKDYDDETKRHLPQLLLNKHYGLDQPTVSATVGDLRQSIDKSRKSMLDPYTAGEMSGNPAGAIAGGAANILTSGARFAGGLIKGVANVFNPDLEQNTLANIARVGSGAVGNAAEVVLGQLGDKNGNLPWGMDAENTINFPGEQQASAIGDMYKNRYVGTDQESGLPNAVKTVYEDPIGFLNDLSLVATGAGAASKAVGFSSFGDDLVRAGIKTDPAYWMTTGTYAAAKPIVKGAAKVTGDTAKFVTSKFTGLDPQTLQTITGEPQLFMRAQAGEITRGALAEKIRSAIETKMDDLSDLGKGYEPIKQVKEAVTVPDGWFDDFMRSRGIDMKTGSLTPEAPPLSPADFAALQQIREQFFKTSKLSGEGLLNARHAMAQKAKYGLDRTSDGQNLFRDMREAFNAQIAHRQVEGLASLDAKYSPLVSEVKSIRDEWLTSVNEGNGVTVWQLKDNATSRIANMTKAGREQALARVEKLVPGIREEVNVLRAMEDVIASSGNKVGTYAQGVIVGGSVGGLVAGVPGAIIGTLLAQPSIIVPILRGYGIARGIAKAQINSIITKLKSGTKLGKSESDLVRNAIDDAETVYAKQTQSFAPAISPDNLDDVPLSQLSTQGVKDAQTTAAAQAAGASYDDALNAAKVGVEQTDDATKAALKAKIGSSPLDDFENAGKSPEDITRGEWVALQRAHRRSLGQIEESGTINAPYSDYEEYHQQAVKEALKNGKEVPLNVLKDYPKLLHGDTTKSALQAELSKKLASGTDDGTKPFLNPITNKLSDQKKIPSDWASYTAPQKQKYLDSLYDWHASTAPQSIQKEPVFIDNRAFFGKRMAEGESAESIFNALNNIPF